MNAEEARALSESAYGKWEKQADEDIKHLIEMACEAGFREIVFPKSKNPIFTDRLKDKYTVKGFVFREYIGHPQDHQDRNQTFMQW